jgi:oxygen-dependent protoporphyrinogen oxidase
MRPQLAEHALVTLLRQCYTTPRCQPRSRRLHISHRAHNRLSCSSSISCAQQRRGYQTYSEGLEGADHHAVQFAAPSHPASGSQPKHDIAILGGGITGLSAAHYLTRELPNARITIYDGSDRLGGWLESKSINVGNGKVVFESGPRTLRPNTAAGLATVEMVSVTRILYQNTD